VACRRTNCRRYSANGASVASFCTMPDHDSRNIATDKHAQYARWELYSVS
jgi:hypothetical protein